MNQPYLRAAALIGAVHASFSLYWALGGRWLLETVGPWALDLARTRPVAASGVLGVVVVLKLVLVAVPLLLLAHRLPGAFWWRLLCLVGGWLMVVYGGLNSVVAWLVLGGVVRSGDGYDRAAMLGHGLLWDPLFLIWGVLLLLGLRSVASARRSGVSP